MCKQALRVSSRQITSYRWVPSALSWNVVVADAGRPYLFLIPQDPEKTKPIHPGTKNCFQLKMWKGAPNQGPAPGQIL